MLGSRGEEGKGRGVTVDIGKQSPELETVMTFLKLSLSREK